MGGNIFSSQSQPGTNRGSIALGSVSFPSRTSLSKSSLRTAIHLASDSRVPIRSDRILDLYSPNEFHSNLFHVDAIKNKLKFTWRFTEKSIRRNVNVGGRRGWIEITQHFPLIFLSFLGFVFVHIRQVSAVFPVLPSAIQMRVIVILVKEIEIFRRRLVGRTLLDVFHLLLEMYFRSISVAMFCRVVLRKTISMVNAIDDSIGPNFLSYVFIA